MTREEWTTACAQHYFSEGGIGAELAAEFATACADSQQALYGPSVSEWESPASVADEDMSYWEDDGDD